MSPKRSSVFTSLLGITHKSAVPVVFTGLGAARMIFTWCLRGLASLSSKISRITKRNVSLPDKIQPEIIPLYEVIGVYIRQG
jgi:hypothetical protein